jgi:2'-hydroxyisoflavone reductase
MASGGRAPPAGDGRVRRMRILTVGGTRFFGRAFVEEAARRGHEVTVFHRGESEPVDFPDVEHLHGDRNGQVEIRAGRSWDAVLDTCAFVPRQVRDLAEAIGDRVGHYTLVSSLSVHPDDLPVGATEETPTHQPPFPDTEDVTEETYGPLKVACEAEAAAAFAGRLLVIRPGYIVGPHDPTDRFTYWVRRAAAGGEMLAAGPPDASIQGIDARDLGAFVLGRIEASDTDTYGVVGPAEPTTTAGVLESARSAGGADTTFVWADREFVLGLGDQHEKWFPMWHPHLPGFHAYDSGKATAAGLRPRPFDETIAQTLAWDRERGLPPLGAGMTPEKEGELLWEWRAQPG